MTDEPTIQEVLEQAALRLNARKQTCPECREPLFDEWSTLIEVPTQLQEGPLSVPPLLCRSCVHRRAYDRWTLRKRAAVSPGHRLEWTDPDRQSLDGREVHCGNTLELYMGGGQWMQVRYEVEHKSPPAGRRFLPVLYLRRPNDLEHARERNALLALVDDEFCSTALLGVMRPDDAARFRWPENDD